MKFSFLLIVIFQYFHLCFSNKFENLVTKKKNRYKTRNTSRRIESNLNYSDPAATINSDIPQKYSLSYDNNNSNSNGLNINEMTNMLQKSEDEEPAYNQVEYIKGTPGKTSPVFEKIKYTTISRNFEKKEVDETSMNFLNIKEKVLDSTLDKNKSIDLNFSSNQNEVDTSKNYRKAFVLGGNSNNNKNSNTYSLIESDAVSDEINKPGVENVPIHTESKVVTSNLLKDDDIKKNLLKFESAQNATSKNYSQNVKNTLPGNNTSEMILDKIMDEVKNVFTLSKDFKFEKSFEKENRVIDVIVRSHNKMDEDSSNRKIIIDEDKKNINKEEKPKIKYISPRYYQHNKTYDNQEIIAKTEDLIKSKMNNKENKKSNLNLNYTILDEAKKFNAVLKVPNYTNSSNFGFLITSEKSFEKKINNSIIHEDRSKEVANLNSALIEKINKKSRELLKKFQNIHNEKSQKDNLKIVSNSKKNTTTNIMPNLNINFSSLNPIFKQEILSKINKINNQLQNLHSDNHPMPHLFDIFNQNSLKENKNSSQEKANITKLNMIPDISNQSLSPSAVTKNKAIKIKQLELNFTTHNLNQTQITNPNMNKNSDLNNLKHYLENIEIITKKIESRKNAMTMDKNINRSTKFSSILDLNIAREKDFDRIPKIESNGTIFLPVHMISNISSIFHEVSKMKIKLDKKEKKAFIVHKEVNVSKFPISLELIRNVTYAVKENSKIAEVIYRKEDKAENKSLKNNEVVKLKEKQAITVEEKKLGSGVENYYLKYNLEKVGIDDNSLISEFFRKK